MAPLIRDLKNFFISHILLFHCYGISNNCILGETKIIVNHFQQKYKLSGKIAKH